jgi:hypothetical protein
MMMPTDRNEPRQADKLAVLHNDILVQAQRERMLRAAMSSVAEVYDDGVAARGGRYALQGRVVTNEVPKQPPNSPWASDPVGREPPLGYSVEAAEPVGGPHEIEKAEAIGCALAQTDAVEHRSDVIPRVSAPASVSFKRRW